MIENNLKTDRLNHMKQVSDYALMIFDAVNGRLFDYSEKERKLLESAALLHDIGYNVAQASHHKHSLNMILEMKLEGFDDYEKEIIAHTARYHRSSFPDETKHKRYAALCEKQKETVKNLASLLRIADGLDNPRKNLITGIEFKEDTCSYVMTVRTVGFAPKLKMANTKKDLFEHLYSKPLSIECKRV